MSAERANSPLFSSLLERDNGTYSSEYSCAGREELRVQRGTFEF